MKSLTDERLTRLRNACCEDSAVDPDEQAALVAYSLDRVRLARAAGTEARELREVKDALGKMLERRASDAG